MRVAFLGKGGSGKTTISTAFSQYAKDKVTNLLAIDADINVHLHKGLGLEGEVVPLAERGSEIMTYLKNNRSDLQERSLLPTTPPSVESQFVRLRHNDAYLEKFALKNGSVSFVAVGTYEEDDMGVMCYHGKLENLEVTLHHLLDQEADLVVADMVTGTDSAGSSLAFAFDTYIFVVEPTLKSVGVYEDFMRVSQSLGPNVKVVINKVTSGDDIEFVKKHIPEDRIIGMFPFSPKLRRLDQDKLEETSFFVTENEKTLQSIFDIVMTQPKDWTTYLTKLKKAHRIMSEAYHKGEAHKGLDESFTYEKVL